MGDEAERVRDYALKVRLPWNRLSDFLRGVLIPLQGEGAEIELLIDLRARSSRGISQATLENKVRETLKQLGGEVLEER